jgi:membrane dipeptidase
VARNVPDAILRMMPGRGGVVMVTFVPGFLSSKVATWTETRDKEEERLKAQFPNDAEAIKTALAAWIAAHPAPRASLADAADHIDHIRKVAGIDHIGLGGDFDGISSVPEGLEDVSTYPALTAELLRRGYTEGDIKKITGRNILRAMREVERVARKLQSARPPSSQLFTK